MSVAAPQAAAGTALGSRLWRFPLHGIFGQPQTEEFLAKAIWLTIPLQFYAATFISGGLDAKDFVAAVSIVVALFMFALLISGVACLFPMKGADGREDRFRRWSIALIVTWATALGLITASYLAADLTDYLPPDFKASGLGTDVLYTACRHTGSCLAAYPDFNATTFFIYLAYAVVAVVVLAAAVPATRAFVRIWRILRAALASNGVKPRVRGPEPPLQPAPAPPWIAVVVAVAALLTLLHAATRIV